MPRYLCMQRSQSGKNWFKLIEDWNVEQGGLKGGRSISEGGTQELSMGNEALTGFTIIEAKSLKEVVNHCQFLDLVFEVGQESGLD